MTTQTNNIKTIENAFINNMGSGKQAAIKLAMLIDMSKTSGDSRSLSNALTRLRKADDAQGLSATRKIILSVFQRLLPRLVKIRNQSSLKI